MKKLFDEFKAFISRGNVLDMAIGVIVATAFSAITNTLVQKVFMPAIGLLTGGSDFTDVLNITVKAAEMAEDGVTELVPATVIAFGDLVAAIINFLLIALICFAIVKAFNKAHEIANAKAIAAKKAEEEAKANEPQPPTTEELLTQIRDLLEKQNKA